jgi:hypothetical protein
MPERLKRPLAYVAWGIFGFLGAIAAMVIGTLVGLPAGDKFGIISSFGLGLVALAVSIWLLRRYGWRRAWELQGLLLIIVIGLMAFAGFTNASKDEGPAGGVNWSGTVDQNMGYASIPGHEWVDAWHRGHYPVGGFTNYRLHLRVDADTSHHGYLTFDSRPTARAFVTDERLIDYDLSDLNNVITRLYGCSVRGHWRAHGCFNAYIKSKMTVKTNVPGLGNFPIYPWVMVRINSAGQVVIWDHSTGIA